MTSYGWIFVIMALAVIGGVVCLLLKVLPRLRERRARRQSAHALRKALQRNVDLDRRAESLASGGSARRMRIVFADPTLAYTADTPYEQPLGGSQSAVCYLAEALAAAGHEVVLMTHTRSLGTYRGVLCTGWERTPEPALRDFRPDAVVAVLSARYGQDLRRIFGDDTRRVLWTQHAHDQAAVQPLEHAAERDLYEGIALVSDWQMHEFVQAFRINPSRARVLGNAVSPAFRNLFAPGAAIASVKQRPPVLAYTSTPYRGLNILLGVFPEIRRRVPGTRLKVFSSMRVYDVAASQDEAKYGELYRQCRETDGVEYIGSLPQPQLARELRGVTALAYPNNFPETYCIAALEAMAAGCRVVSSELGALPQTTAGFARLVPIIDRKDTYAGEFVEAMVETLNESASGADAALLARQVAYVNEACTWDVRAREWLEWLASIPRESISMGRDDGGRSA